MSPLTQQIIDELTSTKVVNMPKLIRFMRCEKGFFWCRSGNHDHWTNGTAQHSWRVYQYMRYVYEHPEMAITLKWTDPDLAPEKIRSLDKTDIILTGLLHDVGKVWGCSSHASKSKVILTQYLDGILEEKRPQVMAAIYFHHNSDKEGGRLNRYRQTTLKKLLNKADGMASGTSWNSTRYKKGKTQHSGTHLDLRTLRHVAMDRTRQTLDYRMYLDSSFNLQTFSPYPSRIIEWNAMESLVKEIKTGKAKATYFGRNDDFVTSARIISSQQTENMCICVGVEPGVIDTYVRSLRQDNPPEESLLICSNVLVSFYTSKCEEHFKYKFCMRPEICQRYSEQNGEKGIYLPDVTFIRDGASANFEQTVPWKANVLLIPGWSGAAVVDGKHECDNNLQNH